MNILGLANFIKDAVDPKGIIKDDSLNDIQVENTGEITKIAVAVDACLATIEGAAKAGAQVLLVHHGLCWGKQLPITGNHYSRVKALIENNIGLIASHLPLDAHSEFGNNIVLAKKIGIKKPEPFLLYNDTYIGFKGELERSLPIEIIVERLGTTMKDVRCYLPFGKKEIKTVGIVSGGAGSGGNVHDAIAEKLDLYISGEGRHSTYHKALEGKINVLLAGHYFTETFGVKALGEKIKKELKIECEFIDCPTGF